MRQVDIETSGLPDMPLILMTQALDPNASALTDDPPPSP